MALVPSGSQGGGGGSGTVTQVSSANAAAAVANQTTTPVITVATLDVLATAGPPAASVPLNSQKITGLLDPTMAQDGATKNYVDAVALGLTFKQPADLGTIAALPANVYANGASGVGATLIATAFGALSVDGTAVAVGQRILVKNEAASANNGIYTVTATGGGAAFYTLTRATDYNQTSEIQAGDAVFVTAGATLADTQWVQTTTGTITVGTTAIAFSQLGATPTLAAVLAVGNSAGTKITNLTNGASAQDAAAYGQLATAGPITSVFSRTGVVAAAASDYTLAQIAAGTNHRLPISGATVMGNLAAGTSGQLLSSGGSSADPAWSTPTYPTTSPTSGKMLQSDGTNILASTPTWPATAGTAANVPRSDGTNFVSAALAAADVTNAADKSSGSGQVFTANIQTTFVRSTSPTSPNGYATGAGGAVTQITSRTTAVTLNKVCGQITTFNSSMSAGAVFAFTVNNSAVAGTDTVIINCTNDATTGGSLIPPYVGMIGSGSFVICYTNNSSGSQSTALVFNFAIIKAVTS